MKYLIPYIALAGSITAGAVCAQDTATINFNGDITAATCSLSINSTTLKIGPVDRNTIPNVGDESKEIGTGALLTDPSCPLSNIAMTFDGAPDPDKSELFAVTGGASGVGIKLEGLGISGSGNAWQQAIPRSAAPMRFMLGTHSFRARYVRTTPTIVNGTANATITVMVTYS